MRVGAILHCNVGFSLQWHLLLQSTDSGVLGLSSCGTLALLLYSTWDLPIPEIELESPLSIALAGRFFTTEPLGKPSPISLFIHSFNKHFLAFTMYQACW